ncbi:MAG: NADH-quinone oxidoreductase subunit J [Desulfovibrionales bacterium]
MQILTYAVYGLYLLLIVVGAFLAVNAVSLVRALVGLIMAMFGIAGMYLLLNTPVMALMQLLIYVGAVGVLIFFAVMLTKGIDRGEGQEMKPVAAALATGLLPAAGLFFAVLATPMEFVGPSEVVPIAELGKGLLGPYILVFELISVVLLVAMLGAVVLGFERRRPR